MSIRRALVLAIAFPLVFASCDTPYPAGPGDALAVDAVRFSVGSDDPAQSEGSPDEEPADLLTCSLGMLDGLTALIGPDGGILSADGHEVRIDRGAVLVPTRFTIRVSRNDVAMLSVEAEGHSSYRFAKPIRITIDYRRCTVPSDLQLGVWYVNKTTLERLQYMGGEDSRTSRKIRFRTDHLSGYAIASRRGDPEDDRAGLIE
jgi:hypothetical protein